MDDKQKNRGLIATDFQIRPGDFALGSPQSRAAARTKLENQLAQRKSTGFSLIAIKHQPGGIKRFVIVGPGQSVEDAKQRVIAEGNVIEFVSPK
jgi:hypothetical protein